MRVTSSLNRGLIVYISWERSFLLKSNYDSTKIEIKFSIGFSTGTFSLRYTHARSSINLFLHYPS